MIICLVLCTTTRVTSLLFAEGVWGGLLWRRLFQCDDDYVITNLVRGNVVTVATELYSMKTGIKMWAAVFGSLIIVGMMVISFLLSCYKCWNKRGTRG